MEPRANASAHVRMNPVMRDTMVKKLNRAAFDATDDVSAADALPSHDSSCASSDDDDDVAVRSDIYRFSRAHVSPII